jgi:hypothetical protein
LPIADLRLEDGCLPSFAIRQSAFGNRKIDLSMARATRRSGLAFLLLGMLGVLFFWVTDPRFGPEVHRTASGAMDWRYALFLLRGSPENVVDAANQIWLSTVVGVMGSLALLGVGFWLLTRRS